jgi:hypothetical protein
MKRETNYMLHIFCDFYHKKALQGIQNVPLNLSLADKPCRSLPVGCRLKLFSSSIRNTPILSVA